MNVFEITIQHRQETCWPVAAEYRRTGELPQCSEETLTLPEDYEVELRMLQLDRRGYSTLLGKALFRESIRDRFREASAGSGQEPLHVLLVVEAPDLRSLHRERLCAPISSGRWDFLITHQHTLYSLYLPSLTDRRFPAIGRRDLHTLVLLADPPQDNRYGLAVFDAEKNAVSIGRALGEIPRDFLGPVNNAVGPASIDALCEQITGGTT